jgi:hypothetical protein
VADLAWTLLTLALVVLSLVILVAGFPGAIGKRAKVRLLRRSTDPREGRGAVTRDARDAR